MTEIEALIAAGRALEQPGSEQQAIDYFAKLAQQYPNDAVVQFEAGGAFDYAGQEAQAVPYYERAQELGLPETLQPRLALQLGSTLRNLERHAEAVHILEQACSRFPEHKPLRAFYALALFSAGRPQRALVAALDALLLEPESLEGYARALNYYVDALRSV